MHLSYTRARAEAKFLEVLTTRIPEVLLKAIREIEKEERAERAEVIRRLLDRAVHHWRITKALRMIREGRWTVRRAAKFTGLTYHEVLDKMAEFGIDSGPTLKDLRQGLDTRDAFSVRRPRGRSRVDETMRDGRSVTLLLSASSKIGHNTITYAAPRLTLR